MLAHHPEDFAVVKALNTSIKKDLNDANSTTLSSTQGSPKNCKAENASENSDDDAEWLDSEFVNCQNSVDNNPTSSQTDGHGVETPTEHQPAVSAPKKFKKNNHFSLNVSGLSDHSMMESNMLFGKFIAAELGRFRGKERYIVMQKIMRILME